MSYCISKKTPQSLNLEDFFYPKSFFNSDFVSGGHYVAPVNVTEDDHQIYVETEIPGVDKKEVEISFQDGILSIAGEKKNVSKGAEENSGHREFSYGRFSRRIKVGDVNFDEAKAEFENGVLKIALPKAEAKKAKKLLLS